VKVVVTELKDGSKAALLSTDTNMKSEQIIEYYSKPFQLMLHALLFLRTF